MQILLVVEVANSRVVFGGNATVFEIRKAFVTWM